MPNLKKEEVVSGHAMFAVGYDDKKKMVLVRNSWGDKWGQKGYFWMPYAYISDKSLSSDFWTVRGVTGTATGKALGKVAKAKAARA